MHGLIFAELKRFVVTNLGGEAWNKVVKDAGLESKVYLPTQVYDDSEIVRAHGGRIWCESPGRDQGSTFAIETPRASN